MTRWPCLKKRDRQVSNTVISAKSEKALPGPADAVARPEYIQTPENNGHNADEEDPGSLSEPASLSTTPVAGEDPLMGLKRCKPSGEFSLRTDSGRTRGSRRVPREGVAREPSGGFDGRRVDGVAGGAAVVARRPSPRSRFFLTLRRTSGRLVPWASPFTRPYSR